MHVETGMPQLRLASGGSWGMAWRDESRRTRLQRPQVLLVDRVRHPLQRRRRSLHAGLHLERGGKIPLSSSPLLAAPLEGEGPLR